MSMYMTACLMLGAAILHLAVGLAAAVAAFHIARKHGLNWGAATAYVLALLSFGSTVIVAMMAQNLFTVAELVP